MAGIFTENGLGVVASRLYNNTKSALSVVRIGTDNTTPQLTDTNLANLVPLTPTTINVCDTPGNWTESADGITPTADTTTFKEGYNTTDDTSLNIGKSGTTDTEVSYYDSVSLDLSASGTYIWAWFYIEDATTLAKLSKAQLRIQDGSGNYRNWDFLASILSTGWNLLSTGDISSFTSETATAPTLASISRVYLEFYTNQTSDTIALGDLKMDFFHYDTYDNTSSAFTTTSSVSNCSQSQGFIGASEAIGYSLKEVGEFNTDSTPIMGSRDTYTAIEKTDEVQINYIFVHEFNNE